MEKEFVPYELAVKLKDLGFNEPCFGRYDGIGDNKGKIWYEIPNSGQDSIPVRDVLAPLYQQAFRWFREKYDLIGWIEKYPLQKVYVLELPKYDFFDDPLCFNTYEETELACLTKLIEIVEQSKN